MKSKHNAKATSEKTFVYSAPEAGAMVGLTRNASYEAVKRGDIPTIRFGKLLKVPKAKWDKIILGETC
jgi:hypothetical protein